MNTPNLAGMAASNKQAGASGQPSIVRMTGFGVDRPTADNEIPIDINYAKLVDWLVGACPGSAAVLH